MLARLVILTLMLSPMMSAQIQVLFEGNPIRSSIDLGSAGTGDLRDVSFTITNAGSASQAITRLSIAGSGFLLPAAPALPFTVTAGQTVLLAVRFQAPASGIYSAALTVNDFSTILRISVIAGLTLMDVTSGGRTIIGNGAKIQFPDSTAGLLSRRFYSLENQGTVAIATPALSISGGGLKLFFDLTVGEKIPPKGALTFQVEAASDSLDLLRGTLSLGDKKFDLVAVFGEPILPAARIVIEGDSLKSGSQTKVSVIFDEDPPGNTRGQLGLAAQMLDNGLAFVDNQQRTISFEVRKGERRAIFGSTPYATLQTGTTSGSAIITFSAANRSNQTYVYFSPMAVQIESIRATRGTNTLEVVLTGFDNTRQVGGDVFFTFYDRNGVSLPAGIYSRVPLADSFTNYFRSSSAGGLFELRTVFPVSGDSSVVSAVEVQIANTVASTKTERTPFQ